MFALNSIFYPSLFGGAVSEQEITLFSLPTHYGGLGINNCVKSASSAFQSSQEYSVLLIDAIVNHEKVCLADHLSHLDAVYILMTRDCGDQSRLLLFSLLSGFPFLTTHAVQQAIDFHASGWLAKCSAPHLLAQQFHDTLCL